MYDVVIVGGGVVGCSILRSLTLAGYQACLVEAEKDLLSHASGSNSGIICTGVDAPLASLERALIRDSISQLRPYCQAHHIPFRPCGALVCIWNDKVENDNEEFQHVFDECHRAGDTHARRLDAEQVRLLEPNLHPSCCGAIHIPGEIVVDPWLLAISYAVHARENGATIFTQFEWDPKACQWDGKGWTLIRKETGDDHVEQPNLAAEALDDPSKSSQPPRSIKARAVINATGVWADMIQETAGAAIGTSISVLPRPTWQTQPRRGQYRIYSPDSASQQSTPFLTHPIQPVPTQFTKGIFVFSTLYDQIVVRLKC